MKWYITKDDLFLGMGTGDWYALNAGNTIEYSNLAEANRIAERWCGRAVDEYESNKIEAARLKAEGCFGAVKELKPALKRWHTWAVGDKFVITHAPGEETLQVRGEDLTKAEVEALIAALQEGLASIEIRKAV